MKHAALMAVACVLSLVLNMAGYSLLSAYGIDRQESLLIGLLFTSGASVVGYAAAVVTSGRK